MSKIPGPPPKPTHLRVIEGDRSRRPGNEREPQVMAGDPPFPYFLEELDAERIARRLQQLTVEKLRHQARALGIRGYTRMRRETLIERIANEEPGPRHRAWRYLIETIDPMKVVTHADGAALAMGVEALVEYVDVARDIEQHGRFWENQTERSGYQIKRHPGIDAQNRAWARVIAVLDRFGANPAYRAKVQVAADRSAGGDPWDELDELGAT